MAARSMGPARSLGRVGRQRSAVELDLMQRVKAELIPQVKVMQAGVEEP